jgi:hypothetical protein
MIRAAGRAEVVSIMATNRMEPLVHAYLRAGEVRELEWLKE